ncbi:MAG: hypothetical protein TUN42_06665 [Dehalogenimonas sp.]
MIYKVFHVKNPHIQIAELQLPPGPVLNQGEKIEISVNGKDGLYFVAKIGEFKIDHDRIVTEILVEDYFTPKK